MTREAGLAKVGDDHTSRHATPDGRAPWERYFSDSPEPDPGKKPRRRFDNLRRPAGRGAPPSRGPARPDSVSVSDLVDKINGTGDQQSANDDTVTIPRVTDPMPDLSGATPAGFPEPERIPAMPVTIGEKPKLTRLAMSRLRRKRRFRLAGRVLVAFIAVIALSLTGLAWGYLRTTDNNFIQVSALDPDSTDVVDPGGQTGDETFLIVGTDTRAGANSEVGAGSAEEFEGTARSDTVMLVSIPANRERVVAVSFPRDLDVDRPQCRGWDNDKGEYTNEVFDAAPNDKLNATYALGGPKCLVKVIQKLSGLRIGHFVGMDFSGFERMVDEIGGVEVCSTIPLYDDELGTVLENAGRQKINGATALNYVRARNIADEGNGDYGRIKRQQLFLSSLLRSALSNNVLLDPGKLNGFIDAFTRETFVEKVTTRDLLTLGRSLQGVEAGAVTFLTVPTDGTTAWGNEVPRLQDIQEIFKAIINDEPLPGEERTSDSSSDDETTSTTPSTSATSSEPAEPQLALDPSQVTVQVSNASGQSGVAMQTANSLGAYGFGIYNVGNYSGTSSKTVVRFSEYNKDAALTVASSIPGAVLEEATGLGSIVDIVVGSEFDGTVNAPTEAGRPLRNVTVQVASADLPADLSVTNAADTSCA